MVGSGPAQSPHEPDSDQRDELSRVRAQLLQAQQQLALLEKRHRKVSGFLAVLGHELRNPLAPILHSVEILERAGGNPELIERSRQVIKNQALHMVRLVDDLLEVARMHSGGLTIHRERVRLSMLVGRALELAEPRVRARRQTLAAELPREPLFLSADPVRLTQAIANLLLNAVEYTPAEGLIEIVAQVEQSELHLSIRDNGVGIRPELLTGLFEMFERGDQAGASAGLGVGLALSRHIVELHGGRIEARSDGVGRGSEFVISLPLPAQRVKPRRRPQAKVRRIPRPQVTPRRVLIVDDQRDVAESLSLLLRMLGHDARFVLRGGEALEEALAFRPELMLVDIGMPELDGHEVARRLRQAPALAGLRLIALSGWSKEDSLERARKAGFDGYLLKPVNQDELDELLLSAGAVDATAP